MPAAVVDLDAPLAQQAGDAGGVAGRAEVGEPAGGLRQQSGGVPVTEGQQARVRGPA
jgi:hypothetical protein